MSVDISVLFVMFCICVVSATLVMCSYVQVYNQIRENIQQADSTADLKWWSVNRGPEMDMSWPAYEACGILVSVCECGSNRVLVVLLFCDYNLFTTDYLSNVNILQELCE